MKKVAILIHGFNVINAGRTTTGKLRPFLLAAGYEVDEITYKFWPIINGLINTHTKNDKVAQSLVDKCQQYQEDEYEITVIGHSNGCTITYLASYKTLIDKIVFINPALERNKAPFCINKYIVYYSNGDIANRLGGYLNWLIPGDEMNRPWGQMGTYGPNYKSDIMETVNEEVLLNKKIGHSDVFKKQNISIFANDMIVRLN